MLPMHDPPEMLTADLAKLVLQAKQIGTSMGILSPSNFLKLAPTPPSLMQIGTALENLTNLGLIVSHGGRRGVGIS